VENLGFNFWQRLANKRVTMKCSPIPCSTAARHLPAPFALVFLAAMGAPHFCAAQTNNLVAVDAITLSTKTPLGDASIVLPAGAPLQHFEVQGEKIKVWQGPFAALVPLGAAASQPAPTENLQPSNPIAATTPSPLQPAPPMPPAAAAMPATIGATDPTAAAKALLQGLSIENLPTWVMPAAVGALAAYALFSTIAWMGLRRRKSTPAAAAAHLPVIIMPKKSSQPAEVKDGGRSIACPLCGTGIPVGKLTGGRNACPSCRGDFVCE
jgi:hypothetical protein